MNINPNCENNGHGYNSDGVCIYCFKDDGSQRKTTDEKAAITQAMLDALPEKIPVDAPSLGVTGDTLNDERLKNWRIGRNQAISEMETAIKLIGGSDE